MPRSKPIIMARRVVKYVILSFLAVVWLIPVYAWS